MGLSLELPIIKGSWEGFLGMGERLYRSVSSQCMRPPAEYLSQGPQVTVPHPAWFSRATRQQPRGRRTSCGSSTNGSTCAGGMAHHWPYLCCCRRRSPAACAPRDAPGQAHGGAHGHCGRRARRRTDAPPPRNDRSCAAGLDRSAAPPLRPGGSCPSPRS